MAYLPDGFFPACAALDWHNEPDAVRNCRNPRELYIAGYLAARRTKYSLDRKKIVAGCPEFWGLHRTAGWVRCNCVERKHRSPTAKPSRAIVMKLADGRTRQETATMFTVFAAGTLKQWHVTELWAPAVYSDHQMW